VTLSALVDVYKQITVRYVKSYQTEAVSQQEALQHRMTAEMSDRLTIITRS